MTGTCTICSMYGAGLEGQRIGLRISPLSAFSSLSLLKALVRAAFTTIEHSFHSALRPSQELLLTVRLRAELRSLPNSALMAVSTSGALDGKLKSSYHALLTSRAIAGLSGLSYPSPCPMYSRKELTRRRSTLQLRGSTGCRVANGDDEAFPKRC